MVVFVCASVLLPSRTDFPANLPVSDRRAEPTEANIVKSILISMIRKIPQRRTQADYLHCLQQFSREEGPFFGEMCVSRCGWAGEPTGAHTDSPTGISVLQQSLVRRSQQSYLHRCQQLNNEKGPIFGEMYVSGPFYCGFRRSAILGGRSCAGAAAARQLMRGALVR